MTAGPGWSTPDRLSLPDADWSTVRLGARRIDCGSDVVSVPASVARRSMTGHSPAFARLDAAPGATDSHAYRPGCRACDTHLWVDPDAPGGVRWAEYADVLVARTARSPGAARCRADELLARYPGCLVAAVPDTEQGYALTVRGGEAGSLWAVPGAAEAGLTAQPHIVASVVHAWLVAGGSLKALRSVRLSAPDRHH